jgi:hypothetical protein
VPVAITVPRAEVSGCGGLSRSDHVGGCANGTALKVSTPEVEEPITVAAGAGAAMVTVSSEALFAGAARARGKKKEKD